MTSSSNGDRPGLNIAFEKILLFIVILTIWTLVLVMEKLMPRQSAPILVLAFLLVDGMFLYFASVHQRRQLASGRLTLPEYPDYRPSVSIVIPAHNEVLVIADTVSAMMALNYDNYDLWVFDDRSTDGTADVLATLAKDFPDKFHYVVRPPEATPGKSAVLNDAIRYTSGEILVIFDADGRVDCDFLTRMLPCLAEPGVGAAQARKVIMNSGYNLLTRCQNHEYMLDAHFQASRDIIRGAVELRGNGQLVKREALAAIGGWNEETITDDLDLSTQLHLAGWDIRFVKDVSVYEEGITRFRSLLRQRRRWAEGSLKRYLEHAGAMFTSKKVSHRAQLDMLAYFVEFLFPLWVVADVTVQVLNFLVGEWPNHIMSSLFALPALGFFFFGGVMVAIRVFERVNPFQAMVWALETSVFMVLVWCPVVMWITGKILLTQDDGPLNWGKTEHLGTQIEVKKSRLERLKQMLQRSGSTS